MTVVEFTRRMTDEERRLMAIRALAAAHGLTSATSLTEMRKALQRIIEIADGVIHP